MFSTRSLLQGYSLPGRPEVVASALSVNQLIKDILLWGDIDGDSKIGLTEAINALRITPGVADRLGLPITHIFTAFALFVAFSPFCIDWKRA